MYTAKPAMSEDEKKKSLPRISSTPAKPAGRAEAGDSELQREIIQNQRKKMREQWKLIEQLKEQKQRLVNHRPPTKPHIVKQIERKMNSEMVAKKEEKMEVKEKVEMKDIRKVENSNDKEEMQEESDECGESSSVGYSEDWEEECSSPAPSSVVPATPELVRRVKEREEQRAAKREQIKRLHEEKITAERERLATVREQELQAEQEERRRTREQWKQKRREEAEKDKKRLADRDRQVGHWCIGADISK